VRALPALAVVLAALTACTSATAGSGAVGSRATTAAATSPALRSSPEAPPPPHSSAALPARLPSSPRPTAATRKVVVRPVDAAGHPAPGYTVETEAATGPVSCDAPSPVAVDRDIRMCSPSAAYAIACWRSADPSWVLCLRDPLLHILARLPLAGAFSPVAAPARPSPQRIVLPEDISCVIRDGGAWEQLPSRPSWAGDYGCNMRESVHGPAGTDGIDRSRPLWTVREVPDSALGVAGTGRPITERPVTTAYFVGTAS
jgi:hypothetical protein